MVLNISESLHSFSPDPQLRVPCMASVVASFFFKLLLQFHPLVFWYPLQRFDFCPSTFHTFDIFSHLRNIGFRYSETPLALNLELLR